MMLPLHTTPFRLARIALIIAVAAASAIQLSLAGVVPAHAASFDPNAAESQLVNLINQDRAQNGLPALALNPMMSSIARGAPISVCPGEVVHGRSQDMTERNYFSHNIPSCGQLVWPALSGNGVQFSAAGENIGWNNVAPQQSSVDAVNSAFMNSAPHRANILGAYNQVGVGAYMASGTFAGVTGVIMYTLIFVQGPLANIPPPAQPSSLYSTLLNGSGSGTVEIHELSEASNYQQFLLHSATGFTPSIGADWQFQVASVNGDGQPDLVAIHLRNTSSGRVEVHALSASSGYKNWIVHAATPIAAVPAGQFEFAFGSFSGDHHNNLYAIVLNNSGSGTVEVHALSEASNYATWIVHTASAFGPVTATGTRFLIGDSAGSGDLIGVFHSATGSGRTEVHALSRNSGYRTFTVHTATPLGYTDDNQIAYILGDRDNDGRPDLYAVDMNNTGSGQTEVHVLSGSSNFSTWIDHAVTGLQPTSPASWQFAAH